MKHVQLIVAACILLNCLSAAEEKVVLFPAISKEAEELRKLSETAIVELKKQGVPTDGAIAAALPLGKFRDFAQHVLLDAGSKLKPLNLPRMEEQLAGFEVSLSNHERLPSPLPLFQVLQSTNDLNETRYLFTDRASLAAVISDGESEVTIITETGAHHEKRNLILFQLQEAIKPYRGGVASEQAMQMRDQAMAASKEWDKYFKDGRPQTFLDILATTIAEREHLKQVAIIGPPDRQWFLLHPNAVIEDIHAAPDGDQLGSAVSIEWLGINWWKGIGKIKVPIGISLTSLYSDRKNVDDVGHGVSIYVANKYCLGWASHGGSNGFFISLDLLKLVDDKQKKLETYTTKIKKLQSALGKD